MLEDRDTLCHHQIADSLKGKQRSEISEPNWNPLAGISSRLISPEVSVSAGWLNYSPTTKNPSLTPERLAQCHSVEPGRAVSDTTRCRGR